MDFNIAVYKQINLPHDTKSEHVVDASRPIPDINEGNPLMVNLLPAHPFAYPFFEDLEIIVRQDENLLPDIIERFHIPKMVFLFPRFNSLWNLLNSQNKGSFVFHKVRPFYPFETGKVKKISELHGCTIVNWFEFLSLLSDYSGKKVSGIPVTVTDLINNRRFACRIPSGMSLDELFTTLDLKIDMENAVFFDHPFNGASLSAEYIFSDLKPHSLIIVAKNSIKKPSFPERLKRMIFQKNVFYSPPLYNSSPSEVGTPCQKCLRCVRVCPDKIAPFVISALYRNESIREAKEFMPELCRECGLCTYICPSGIPLLHNIRALKKKLGMLL